MIVKPYRFSLKPVGLYSDALWVYGYMAYAILLYCIYGVKEIPCIHMETWLIGIHIVISKKRIVFIAEPLFWTANKPPLLVKTKQISFKIACVFSSVLYEY